MQLKKSVIAISFIIYAVSGFIFTISPKSAPQTAVAGAVTPDVLNYLPLVLNPAEPTPTPTATIPPTATTAPADVQITLIVYNPAGNDVDGEYVRIENKGGTAATMTGWTLSDDDGRVYTFPSFSLAAGATVQVWTKAGVNNASNLYWGDALSIWTNTGDVAYLRNGGTLVDSCAYAGGGVQASC